MTILDYSRPQTLTLGQAATLLGIGRSTAYELARRGDFPVPVLRVGRSVKVSVKAIEEFLEGPA